MKTFKRIKKLLLATSMLLCVLSLAACTGAPGKKGEKGDSGSSAYQIWLGNGHTGTEADYLTWLKGEDGTAGVAGDKGDKGDKGDPGDTPYIGENGNWWIGETDTGINASGTGPKGDKGDPGEQGAAGLGVSEFFVQGGYLYVKYTDGNTVQIIKVSDIDPSRPDLDYEFELLSDGSYGVKSCLIEAPETITLPNSYNAKPVTKILSAAFKDAATLVSVEIPDTILEIGESAFSGCTSLTTVDISVDSSLKYIATMAFKGCVQLEGFYLPLHTYYIGEKAFEDCAALTEIYFPSETYFIGARAFYGSGLQTATFQSVTNWNITGTFQGYSAVLQPSNPANNAKALSRSYTNAFNSYSNYYDKNWERDMSGNSATYTKEL